MTWCVAVIFLAVAVTLPAAAGSKGRRPDSSCKEVGPLLTSLSKRKVERDTDLVRLFQIGDRCNDDLIAGLNGPDFNVNVAAQEVIRYLGNRRGMEALDAWNSTNKKFYPVWGPVPVPIMDFDYKIIEASILVDGAKDLGFLSARYIYALALDNSPRAKQVFSRVARKVASFGDDSLSKKTVNLLSSKNALKPFDAKGGLEKAVLDNAIFLSAGEKGVAKAKLLGFNANKDKALIELDVSKGVLAEKRYHVVVSRNTHGWQFFSINLVSVS